MIRMYHTFNSLISIQLKALWKLGNRRIFIEKRIRTRKFFSLQFAPHCHTIHISAAAHVRGKPFNFLPSSLLETISPSSIFLRKDSLNGTGWRTPILISKAWFFSKLLKYKKSRGKVPMVFEKELQNVLGMNTRHFDTKKLARSHWSSWTGCHGELYKKISSLYN